MTEGCIRSAVVEAIHSSPTQAVLFLSGGASQVLGWFLSVPGASNTVLESLVPYSKMSMIHLLGKIPAQFASHHTADEMALLAYNRALKLSQPGRPVLGVGFTGNLASARPKFGEHRFYLSTRTSNQAWRSAVTLLKGLRTREEEDSVSSHMLLKAIARACEVPATFVSGLTESEVPDECETLFSEDEELEQLIKGHICCKVYSYSYVGKTNLERRIILSGSFNPLHDGHLNLMEVASSIFSDGYPCFEIAAVNADKPPLRVSEIKNRIKQFEKAGKTVIISNQPFFYKKAELFPGSVFVIGADTAMRLIDPRYYDDDPRKMLAALDGCKRTGCIFLVAGRTVDGTFKVLEDIDIPDELNGLFVSIPASRFRMDISSTEMRRQGNLKF